MSEVDAGAWVVDVLTPENLELLNKILCHKSDFVFRVELYSLHVDGEKDWRVFFPIATTSMLKFPLTPHSLLARSFANRFIENLWSHLEGGQKWK